MTHSRIPYIFRFAAMWIAAFVFLAADVQSVQAQQVIITKGDQKLTGQAMGYDGTYLRLLTDKGEVTVDMRGTQCEGAPCPRGENFVPLLRFSGAARLSDLLLPALIEGYARAGGFQAIRRDIDETHFEYDVVDAQSGLPELRFAFHVTSSSEGFADLISDQADAVLSDREVMRDEAQLASEAGLGALREARSAQIVAFDALVPIVSPRSALEHVSMNDLAALFSGEISDWDELSAGSGAVSLHLPEATHPTARDFRARALGDANLAEGIVRHGSAAEVAMSVGVDPNAIGIVPFDNVGIARTLPLQGACGMRSIADVSGLKTEDYPLTRPLFIYWPARRLHPALKKWRLWLHSADAHVITRRAGFVDRGILRIPWAQQGARLAQAVRRAGDEISLEDLQFLLTRLEGLDRWSVTFRFTPGATRLDAQSRSNILQIARGIRDGDYDGMRLVFVGFSDGKGPAPANRALSEARAQAVVKELTEVLGGEIPADVETHVEAFGEVLPMACDDSDWGAFTNRRVELWVAPER